MIRGKIPISLQGKVIVVLGIVLGVMSALALAVQVYFTYKTYHNFEESLAKRRVANIVFQLEQHADQLNHVTLDWSDWMTTYQFTQKPDAKFPRFSGIADVGKHLEMTFALITDVQGRALLYYWFDHDDGHILKHPPYSSAVFRSLIKRVAEVPADSGIAGLLPLDGNIYIVAGRPITDSSKRIGGYFLFGKAYGHKSVGNILDEALFKAQIFLTRSPELPVDVQQQLQKTSSPDTTTVVVSKKYSTMAYEFIPDVLGNLSIILRIEQGRDFYELRKKTLSQSYMIWTALGVAIVLVMVFLLRGLVLKRLLKLDRQILEIAAGNTNLKVSISGEDELARLSSNVNDMVVQLRYSSRQIEESEQRFQSILMSAPVFGMILDTEGTIVFCNEYFANSFEWNSADVVGLNYFDYFIDPSIREDIRKRFLRAVTKGTFNRVATNPVCTRSGGVRMVSWSLSMLFSPEGYVTDITCIGEDVTDRETAQRLMDEREKFIEALTDVSRLLVPYLKEVPAHEFLARMSETCGAGRSFVLKVNSPDTDKPTFTVEAIWESESSQIVCGIHPGNSLSLDAVGLSRFVSELRTGNTIVLPAGSLLGDHEISISIDSSLFIPLLIDQQLHGVLIFCASRTDLAWEDAAVRYLQISAFYLSQAYQRNIVERELQTQTNLLAQLFHNTPDAIVYIDEQNRIRDINEQFTSLFGYVLADIIGINIDNLIVPHETLQEAIAISNRARGGETIRTQGVRVRKDGSLVEVEIQSVPVLLDGKTIGAYGIYRDVTERSAAERKMLETNKRLEIMYSMADFVSQASNLEEVYKFAFDELRREFVPAATVFFMVDTSGDLKIEASDSFPADIIAYVLSSPEIRNLAMSAESVSMKSIVSRDAVLASMFNQSGFVSLASCSVSFADHVVGRLMMLFSTPVKLSENSMRLLEAVGDNLGGAIQHFSSASALVYSEERFRTIFENARDGILLYSTDGILLDVNKSAADLIGVKAIDIAGKSAEGFVPLDVALFFHEFIANVIMTREIALESVIINVRGEEIPVEYEAKLIVVSGQECILMLFRDITERIRSTSMQKFLGDIASATAVATSLEDLLKIIHEQLSTVMVAENFYVALYDAESGTYSFPYHVDQFDEWPEGSIRMDYSLTDFTRRSGEPLLIDQATHKELFDAGEISYFGTDSISWLGVPLIAKGRSLGLAALQSYREDFKYSQRELEIVKLASGQIALAIERKQHEEDLKNSELRYRQLFALNQAIKLIVDPLTGRFIEVNPAALRYFGHSLADLLRMSIYDIFTSPREEIDAMLSDAINDRRFYHRLRTKVLFGEQREIEVYSGIVTINNNAVLHFIIHDVTDRIHAESENRRLATLVESATDAIMMTDLSGVIVYVNPAYERITGYTRDELLGRRHVEIYRVEGNEELFKNFRIAIQNGVSWTGRIVNARRDGTQYTSLASILPVRDSNGEIINFAGIERDITGETELQTQLNQAQRLASIGQLTGGIAHNFNNLLTGVMGNLGLAKMHSHEPVISFITEAENASRRAADLVKQLLTFSRKTQIEKTTFDIRLLLKEVVSMIRNTVDRRIAIGLTNADDAVFIDGDVNQLHQVVLNMCVNAVDALKDVDPDVRSNLHLRLSSGIQVKLDEAQLPAENKPGVYSVITVSDNGTGIPKEVVKHIFDPFFTTKSPGKGTGLGLATAYGIVQQHDGWIDVETEEGVGTTFHIYIPYSENVETRDEREHASQTLPQGSGSILLIDDEEMIRSMGVALLTKLGYNVASACNGKEGLDYYLANEDSIHLIILDLSMPVMSGIDFLKELKKRDKTTKVIVSSGFSEEHVDMAIYPNVKGFVSKPYEISELASRVKTELG